MKTNLFIATALLLSVAGFGQQTDTKTNQTESAQTDAGKNRKDVSVQASANADVKSGAGGSMENQVATTKKKVKTTSSSVEKKTRGEENTAIVKSREATDGNTSAQASLQTHSDANAASGNNKLSQNTSLNNGAKVSSTDVKNQAEGLNGKDKGTMNSKTNESLKTAAMVKNETEKGASETKSKSVMAMDKTQTTAKTSAKAASSTTAKTAGGIKQSIKPKPVSMSVQSKIKTNAGIKIK